jgi:hypothetical protein
MEFLDLILAILLLSGAEAFFFKLSASYNWHNFTVFPVIMIGVSDIILITYLIIGLCYKDKRNIIRKGKTDWK